MLQLTYISTAGRDDALDAILRASRRRNAADGVTGLLLFDGRRFLQALEGDAAAVQRTYDRIAADPRHRAIVLLSRREVEARDFGAWAMAAETARPAPDARSIAETVDALTETVADRNVQALFRSFARLKRAA